jgi:hypothetical protein
MSSTSLQVAVLMAHVAVKGRASVWQSHRWQLRDVVAHDDNMGSLPMLIDDNPNEQVWLHPAQTVELFKDTAEGYHLNLDSPQPCFWVLWRMEDEPGERADGSPTGQCIAYPEIVTLSYHDAGRWLDAQENVEQVPAAREVIEWLAEFTAQHHVPEEKKRKRPQSFLSLQDRFGNPARVTTEKR